MELFGEISNYLDAGGNVALIYMAVKMVQIDKRLFRLEVIETLKGKQNGQVK